MSDDFRIAFSMPKNSTTILSTLYYILTLLDITIYKGPNSLKVDLNLYISEHEMKYR